MNGRLQDPRSGGGRRQHSLVAEREKRFCRLPLFDARY
jgi:hypothetical protein